MKKTMKIVSAGLAALLAALTLTSCSLQSNDNTAQTASVPDAAQSVQIVDSDATVISFHNNSATVSGSGVSSDGADVTIRSGGVYTVRGATTDGGIVVDAQDADVTIVLDGASITAGDSSAILIRAAKQATIYAKENTENTLTDSETYADEESDACIWSKADLILAGSGSLTVNGKYENGVTSKDTLLIDTLTLNVTASNNGLTGKDGLTVQNANVTVTAGGGSEAQLAEDTSAKGLKSDTEITIDSGTLTIDSADDGIHANETITVNSGKITIRTGDDGIHADDTVKISGGEITITGHEGIEGTRITLDDGKISITASDDGINAAQKIDDVTPTVEINGGEIEIEMGQGDTDGIDANGDIIINGGTVRVTAQFPFDYDGKGELNGGEVYVNGEKVTELTNQFGGMGDRMGERPQRSDDDSPQGSDLPERFQPPQDGEFPEGGTFPGGSAFPKDEPQDGKFPSNRKGEDNKNASEATAEAFTAET